jgi:hypothetical protein
VGPGRPAPAAGAGSDDGGVHRFLRFLSITSWQAGVLDLHANGKEAFRLGSHGPVVKGENGRGRNS